MHSIRHHPASVGTQIRQFGARRNRPRKRSGCSTLGGYRAEPIGAYVTAGDRSRTVASKTGTVLRAAHAAGVAARCAWRASDTSNTADLAGYACPHPRADPASLIYVGSDAEIRRRCHLIDTLYSNEYAKKCGA
jgi:hypothetical protein